MNNQEALSSINDCNDELTKIQNLIETVGGTSPLASFLTRYATIKSCGTIELCFKTIISDIHSGQSPQIVNYVDSTIRNSSMNPSLDNIYKVLKKFDFDWYNNFKEEFKKLPDYSKLKDSLESLNEARNTFAHGKYITASFYDIKSYYHDSVKIIKILDNIVID